MKLIVHTPLLKVVLPDNTNSLFVVLITVSSFDFLQSSEMTDYIFGRSHFSKESLESYDDKFNELSYNNKNFIYNMGTIFYIYCLVLVLTLLAVIFTLCFNKILCCRKQKLLKKIKNYCQEKITPGLYFRLFIETHFELLIASYLQFNVKEN